MTDDPIDSATNLIGVDNRWKLKQAGIAVGWEKDVKQNCGTCRYDNTCSWNCWQGVRRPGYVYVTMAKARKSFFLLRMGSHSGRVVEVRRIYCGCE